MISKKCSAIFLGIVITLAGLIGSNDFANADSNVNINYNNSYGTTHWTRFDMESALSHEYQTRFLMPKFNNKQALPISSAKAANGDQLSVWDSWQLKNPDGSLANVDGYYVVFAMQGDPKDTASMNGSLGLYYQKVTDSHKGIGSWQYGGPVFTSNSNGNNSNNEVINNETNQWSGSAVMLNNNVVRLFYTSYNSNANSATQQVLSTAQLHLVKNGQGISVDTDQTSDRKPIFAGDGKYYESYAQANAQNQDVAVSKVNDHTLRDPQIVFDQGKKYLIFESNTGPKAGGAGYQTLNNAANYGGSKLFQQEQTNLLNENININVFSGANPIKTVAAYNNACLGIVELNDDYTVKKVMKPLVVFNGTHDETERPAIIKYHNLWYLFTSLHGWHMASANNEPGASYMLGFVSNNLLNGYKPLNQTGLVIYNKSANNTPFLYSYNVLPPQSKNGQPILTGYITPGPEDNNPMYKTFGPSLNLYLGKDTTYLGKHAYNQGQLVN